MTLTSGPSARREWWCKAVAMSSLPVPLSPWMSTVALVWATCSMSEKIWRMGAERPMILPKENFSDSCRLSRTFSSTSRLVSTALSISSSSLLMSTGLDR